MSPEKNIQHPFFPRNISIPHYKPNTASIQELLGIFFGLLALALVGTWFLARRRRFGYKDRLIMCWFVGCGFIHTVLEGYFCVNHATLAGQSTYLAQMWKEYGKADSRYITWRIGLVTTYFQDYTASCCSDTFTVVMESITAFIEGPLCFATVLAYVTRNPYRYVLQMIVSIGQLYGDSLYMLIEAKEGFVHGDYNHPLHFWFYFVFLNLWWIFVPLIMIVQAAIRIGNTQSLSDSRSSTTQSKKKKK